VLGGVGAISVTSCFSLFSFPLLPLLPLLPLILLPTSKSKIRTTTQPRKSNNPFSLPSSSGLIFSPNKSLRTSKPHNPTKPHTSKLPNHAPTHQHLKSTFLAVSAGIDEGFWGVGWIEKVWVDLEWKLDEFAWLGLACLVWDFVKRS
jgi:hypothetical protein